MFLVYNAKLRAIPEKIPGGGGGGGGGVGGGGRRRYIFLWVVDAGSFQIIWVIGVRPNLITWVVGVSLAAWKGKEEYYLPKKERSFI